MYAKDKDDCCSYFVCVFSVCAWRGTKCSQQSFLVSLELFQCQEHFNITVLYFTVHVFTPRLIDYSKFSRSIYDFEYKKAPFFPRF